jgi:thioredoxin 1
VTELNSKPRQIAPILPTDQDGWLIACLCAGWCNACTAYRPQFQQWSARHPEKSFVWIDIEDQADLVGDIELEKFPVLLIQRGDIVVYFGAVETGRQDAERILAAQTGKSTDELRAEASSSEMRRQWQRDVNLCRRMGHTPS